MTMMMMMIGVHPFKIKGPLLLLTCILVTSVFYCLIGDPKPSLSTIVTETNRQLASPLKRLRQVVIQDTPSYYYRTSSDSSNRDDGNRDDGNRDDAGNSIGTKLDEEELESNHFLDQYLAQLGFTSNPKLFDPSNNDSEPVTLPIFVTSIKPGQIDFLPPFVTNFHENFPDSDLIVFSVLLDDDDLNSLNKSCNVSVSCHVRIFDFDSYPPHVKDLKLSAFRPLIIQSILNQSGSIVWIEIDSLLLGGSSGVEKGKNAIRTCLESSSKIYSWTIEEPTSSMTHPKMFEYFQTRVQNFYFHRMIEPNVLIVYNTKKVHNDLMLPWIKCILIPDCISPIGAQSSGCRFDKKPLFRYSGCHFYDTSALNVVLGLMFDFSHKPYSSSDDTDKFFRKITIQDLTENEIGSTDQTFRFDSSTNESTSSLPKLSFNKSGWRIRH